jgi:ParB family chromosome partitioning protein
MTTLVAETVTHRLKTHPGHFSAVKRGAKLHEIRENDRGFAENHRILLQEWDPVEEDYTGDELMVLVTYITRGPDWNIPRGWVVMSIKPITMPTHVKGDLEESRRRRDAVGAEEL